jgi:hypothetical protein
MRTFYVIKNIVDNTYLSYNEQWDSFLKSESFMEESDAIRAIGRLDGYFVIEKVYHI